MYLYIINNIAYTYIIIIVYFCIVNNSIDNFKKCDKMKILNKTATITFNKLVELAKANDGHIKIDNTKGFFMPVVVEVIEESENLVKVSIAHYYEQNGDLMADPEMCFALRNDKLGCMVMPYYCKQDGLGIERESIIFDGETFKGIRLKMQADHTAFANMWMRNIKSQQKI